MKLRISITAFLITVVFILTPLTVYADQADPDSTPTAEFYCWRNILEAGDFLLVIYANIPYASVPDEPVSSAFFWRLIDTDNVTELGSDTGYAYNDSGYGYNVYSMYWSASTAPTWGTAYPVRLIGNPYVFDTPPVYNYTLGASDYSSLTATADVQAALAAWVINTAADLDINWGLTPTTSLLEEQETGTYLSLQGQSVFRAAIYGLQGLAPDAFYFASSSILATDRSWNPEYSTNLTTQWSGTWVETARTSSTAFFGTGYDLLSIVLVLILVGGVAVGGLIVSGNIWPGMLDGALVAVLLARLDMYELGFLALIAAMCWLYVSGKLWGLFR